MNAQTFAELSLLPPSKRRSGVDSLRGYSEVEAKSRTSDGGTGELGALSCRFLVLPGLRCKGQVRPARSLLCLQSPPVKVSFGGGSAGAGLPPTSQGSIWIRPGTSSCLPLPLGAALGTVALLVPRTSGSTHAAPPEAGDVPSAAAADVVRVISPLLPRRARWLAFLGQRSVVNSGLCSQQNRGKICDRWG